MNFDELIKKTEELIRSGNRDGARALIAKLKGESIPRARASTLATLARRVGAMQLALKIMMPIIRPKVPLAKEASDEEKATYAVILLGLGASSEAIEVLEEGNANSAEIALASAFVHINRWDYSEAISHLKSYIRIGSAIPYQLMIAKVNLAASYVALGQVPEGKELLIEILSSTRENHWHLLHKNALELDAQLAIREGDWTRALERLSNAESGGENVNNLFVKKWHAILAISRDGATPSTLDALMRVREIACQTPHWETIRDCDFHRAMALKDPQLFRHVYFGTPFESFRQRMLTSAAEWMQKPEEYTWNLTNDLSERVFDLFRGEEVGGSVKVKPGKGLYTALQTLTSDFYRPFVLGSLHSSFFPKQHFNPSTSPRRVAFLLHRLRNWLKECDIPIAITSGPDGYRIESRGNYAFLFKANAVVESESDDPNHFPILLEKIRHKWIATPFSAAEIAQQLDVSMRSARYLLQWALKKDKIERLGNGRATQYRIIR